MAHDHSMPTQRWYKSILWSLVLTWRESKKKTPTRQKKINQKKNKKILVGSYEKILVGSYEKILTKPKKNFTTKISITTKKIR